MLQKSDTPLQRLLPSRIAAVRYTPPIATLLGGWWELSLACEWRVSAGELTLISSHDDDLDDALTDLVGCEILEIDRAPAGGPVLALSDGLCLELFVNTYLAPWGMRVGRDTYLGTRAAPTPGDGRPRLSRSVSANAS